jgi:plastocyanin
MSHIRVPGTTNRSLAVAVLWVAVAALSCSTSAGKQAGEALESAATQQPSWKQNPTTNKPRKHVVVQFSDASMHPSIARVTAGGNVTWVNYSSSYTGAVVFPDSFPASLTCGEARPRFAKVAAGYQSSPIAGDMGEGATSVFPRIRFE